MSGLKIAVESTIGTSYGLGEGDMARELEACHWQQRKHRHDPAANIRIGPIDQYDVIIFYNVIAHLQYRPSDFRLAGPCLPRPQASGSIDIVRQRRRSRRSQ